MVRHGAMLAGTQIYCHRLATEATMQRKYFTHKFLDGRVRPAATAKAAGIAGQSVDWWDDGGIRGFGLRVTPDPHLSWMLMAPYPMKRRGAGRWTPNLSRNPTRVSLGDVFVPPDGAMALPLVRNGALTLAEARAKARAHTRASAGARQ